MKTILKNKHFPLIVVGMLMLGALCVAFIKTQGLMISDRNDVPYTKVEQQNLILEQQEDDTLYPGPLKQKMSPIAAENKVLNLSAG